MKPVTPILPLVLLCAVLQTSATSADPHGSEVQLAQAPPGDKGGEGQDNNKDQRDRGKGRDKGEDGKGPDRGREDRGQDRGGERGPGERKGERPPEQRRDNGQPQQQQRPPQQQQRESQPPPQRQPERRQEQPPQRQPERKPEQPRPQESRPEPRAEQPIFKNAPPKADDRGRDRGDWRNGRPDQDGRDNRRPDSRRPDSNGPEQKGPEPKAPEQKAPPPAVPDQPQTQRPENRPPAAAPAAPERGPRDAGRGDDRGRVGDRRGPDRRDDSRQGDGRDRDWRGGPPGPGQGPSPDRPERGRWSGGQPPAPSEARDINDLKSKRRERAEDGGKRVIIEEPDKRRIIREGNRTIIRHDETERFRRISRDTRIERRDGLDISVTLLPGGIRIYTDLDNDGRPLRRYRRGPDGRDVILFDNRDYYRRARGGSFLDAIIDLPPPRIRIPRERYIVDYDRASYDDIYEALDAGPVDELDRGYSLEEVRRSPMLRDRMRRVDLDTVNFNFGSWTVDYSQYGALERVAQAMNRIIERNPAEMFLIEGHTDAVGSDEDNLSLSDRRAESVAIILTEEFGVPPENLTTQGYGEQYLKIPTDGPERANRRVAVRKITPLLAR